MAFNHFLKNSSGKRAFYLPEPATDGGTLDHPIRRAPIDIDTAMFEK